MPLTAGTRLGPYEVTAQIGIGGMGEVYRATDTSLKRAVAIKVLPASVAGDTDRLARFQREAEVLAALNHPNIAAIYGLERSGAMTALVMELVEGPTLADRIAQGAVSIDEALPVAKQIAEALEAAHEQGIVHRDLKPANIKVRPDGVVKVLDFGLAKVMEPVGAVSASASMAPTITTPAMTRAGMILGTAAYMSPEQVKGREADKRSDIWAFGCVLYEMLSGVRAFDGDDMVDVLGAVARLEPDWLRLPAGTPRIICTLVQNCLAKNRKDRLGDVAGILFALRNARLDGDDGASATVQQVAAPWWNRVLPLTAALFTGGILVGGVALSFWPRLDPRAISRFAIDLEVTQRRGAAVISPDGQRVAVSAAGGVYVRDRDALEVRLVYAERSPIAFPIFSPDGTSIAFYESGQLKRIDIKGGAPTTIANVASNLFGASWSDDDTILFGQPQGIMRVDAAGGTPEVIVAARAGELVSGPQLLPDGRTVLYSVTATSNWSDAQVVAQRVGTGDRVVLVNRGSDARYLPTGHLVYAFQDQLFAIGLDAARLATRGRAESVLQGIEQSANTGSASYGLSSDGTLVYARSGVALNTLVWVDRQGREVPLGSPANAYTSARVSPDGSRVAFAINPDVWVYSLKREILENLGRNSGRASVPQWSPTGNEVAFYADGIEGGSGVFRQLADGSGSLERLMTGSFVPLSWSADGRQLVYLDFGVNIPGTPPPDADLGVLKLDGASVSRPLMKTPAQEDNADISPDGRWIAYETNELGQWEVFVRPFPDVDRGRWRISTAGGFDPVWARDGRTLFYRAGQAIMEVSVNGLRPTEWGRPTRLFEGDYVFSTGQRYFDVGPDGRFLMIKREGGGTVSQSSVIVVQNWSEELKRLVPIN